MIDGWPGFYRICLSLFKMLEPEILACQTFFMLHSLIQKIKVTNHTPDLFVNAAQI
jgi:hypothetical protein